MGELRQAKDYHENAMAIYVNVLGPNHIHVATSFLYILARFRTKITKNKKDTAKSLA